MARCRISAQALLDADLHVELPDRSIGKTTLTAPRYATCSALDALVKSPQPLGADNEDQQKQVASVPTDARAAARSVVVSD